MLTPSTLINIHISANKTEILPPPPPTGGAQLHRCQVTWSRQEVVLLAPTHQQQLLVLVTNVELGGAVLDQSDQFDQWGGSDDYSKIYHSNVMAGSRRPRVWSRDQSNTNIMIDNNNTRITEQLTQCVSNFQRIRRRKYFCRSSRNKRFCKI